jgi:hypothetical protein
MTYSKTISSRLSAALFSVLCVLPANAQYAAGERFVHPGGLHTQADLDRMRAKVAAGEHPWIDSWNALIANPKAQHTYKAKPLADLGVNRQRGSADAVAAYLNALRWRIANDTRCADCAVKIWNEWAERVDVIHCRGNDGGLDGIATYEFALAGELLRGYPDWKPEEVSRFKSMLINISTPVAKIFW